MPLCANRGFHMTASSSWRKAVTYHRAANRFQSAPLQRGSPLDDGMAEQFEHQAKRRDHAQLVLYNGTPSPVEERKHALLLSERAGVLDPDDPLVLTARCAVHTMAGQFDHARALISRSLELDPTLVWSWDRSGWLNTYLGNVEAALRDFEQATRLDPRGPNAIRLTGLGCAYFDAGRYEEAVRCKRMALRYDPGTAWINRSLSVSYARVGNRLAALESIAALRRYSPDITISKIVAALPFTQDYLDRVAEGLDGLGLAP